MKIVIEGREYPLGEVHRLTLREIVQLEQQSEKLLGRRLNPAAIEQMQQEIAACKTAEERKNHPHASALLAVGIWVARTRAGDSVTLFDALDFPADELAFIREDGDPDEEADPTPARPGSGRAGVPADHKRKASKPKSHAASS